MGCSPSRSFQYIESSQTNATTMVLYIPHDTTQIITDASSVGLGAILSQQQEIGEQKLVVYVSWSLTNVELRYSQTEKKH